MAEIEKKFLVREGGTTYASSLLEKLYPTFQELVNDIKQNGKIIRQGYLPIEKGILLAKFLELNLDFEISEARLRDKNGELFFTIKGDGTIQRDELETSVSREIFDFYWPETAGKRVEKIRLEKPYVNHILEIDFYLDRELVVAEVEVGSQKEAELFPPLGKDITSDKSYKNKNLAR